MFAMLGGAFPADVESAVDAQLDAGLELVTDGRETLPAAVGARAALLDDLLAGRGSGAVAAWNRAEQRLAGRAVAGPTVAVAVAVAATMPGPWSLAAADGGVRVRGARAIEIGEALGDEVAALRAAGCTLVRIDEPTALDLAAGADLVAAFTAAHGRLGRASGVGDDAVHLMLALTGGSHETVGARALADLAYASFLFDLVRGPDDWRLIAAMPGDRGIVCGGVDAATPIGDAPEVLAWAAHYAASTGGRGLARVGLATTGSLAALDIAAALGKVRSLVEGARIAALPRDELALALDPRAVDMRSAALGRWDPDVRPARRPDR